MDYVKESKNSLKTSDLLKKIRGFESKAHKRLLNISYKERKKNILVNNLINKKDGSYVHLIDIIMRRKMTKFGHITRPDSMFKTILRRNYFGESSFV